MNTKKLQDIERIAFTLALLFIIGVVVIPKSSAQGFGIQINICTPEWYCTNYTYTTCGTRDCIDANACEITLNKPILSIECPSRGGGGSSGGGGSVYSSILPSITYPQGYFTTNKELIKIDFFEGDTSTKTLTITPKYNETYNITIKYPDEYNQSKTLVTPDIKNVKTIAGETSDIVLFFNSTGVREGTYVLTTLITGKSYSKNITTIVNVIGLKKSKIDFDISVDSNLKSTNNTWNMNTTLLIKKALPNKTMLLLYVVRGPDGKIINILEKERKNNDSKINTALNLPPNLKNGYYTLTVSAHQRKESKSKSVQFTILNEKYSLIEQPTQIPIKISVTNWKFVLLSTLSIIIVLGIGFVWRKGNQKKYFSYLKKNLKSLNIKEGVKNLFKSKTVTNDERRRILNVLHARGFISSQEHELFLRNESLKDEPSKKKTTTEEIKIATKETKDTSASKKEKEIKEKKVKEEKKKPIIKTKEKIVPSITITTKIKTTKQNKQKLELFEKVIDEGRSFYLNNGEVLHSIKDLVKHLEKNDLDTFNHHTKEGRNDFANWIEGVFEDKELAMVVRNSGSISQLKKNIKDYFSPFSSVKE